MVLKLQFSVLVLNAGKMLIVSKSESGSKWFCAWVNRFCLRTNSVDSDWLQLLTYLLTYWHEIWCDMMLMRYRRWLLEVMPRHVIGMNERFHRAIVDRTRLIPCESWLLVSLSLLAKEYFSNNINNNNSNSFLFQRISVLVQRFNSVLLRESFTADSHLEDEL